MAKIMALFKNRDSRLKASLGLAVTVAIFSLVGCTRNNKDYDYFLSHPQEVVPTIKACQMMSTEQATNDDECAAAVRAKATFSEFLMDYQSNPFLFGKKLMQLQMEIAKNKSSLSKLKHNHGNRDAIETLKHTITKQQRQLNTLYTVIRLNTRM